MITLERFRAVETAVRAAGYGDAITWSESIKPPDTPEEFAARAIYVICNSGMGVRVATAIYDRCVAALHDGRAATSVFGHPGKAAGIDRIWSERAQLFDDFQTADDVLTFCMSLPWTGPITAHHLAKNLGVDTAKPDIHLQRLGEAEGCTALELCARLSRETGYRVATIDTILWRACADGLLNSRVYLESGWDAAFHPDQPTG